MNAVIKTINSYVNPEKAKILQRFFKTGKGQYGEADIFLGIIIPIQRKIATQFSAITLTDVVNLIKNPIHEYRMIGLFILINQYKRGEEKEKKIIFNLYIQHTDYINNWDLVDVSAPHIVGDYLKNKEDNILYTFAKSQSVWKKRIAMLATFTDIKGGRYDRALAIADILVNDSHDLIQKAVGWMLREIGKRGGLQEEEQFLKKYATTMPRTMLRYAIERFPEEQRQYYLKQK